MSKLSDERMYYAQNREDLILESFFRDTKRGFYVDVGACHPHVASVTKRFYLKGWSGINIEPQSGLCALFDAERTRDINVNAAVSDKESTAIMRAYINNRGLTTFAPDMKNEYEKATGNKTEEYEDITLQTTTLKTLFDQYGVTAIQFLKVDVEGYEYEVLNGNDWEKYRPEVICIESNHIIKDWRPLLSKKGYERKFFDGLNEYYVDNQTGRASKFNYIDHVVNNLKGGVSSDDYEEMECWKKLACEQKQEIQALQNELRSVKNMFSRIVKLLPSRVKRMLPKLAD